MYCVKTHYLCWFKLSKYLFSDGPENVQITGPSEINVKQTLTLTCSAASTPSASYTWKLNGTNIFNNSAVFTKDVTELSDSGNYTCRALNKITGRTLFAVHRLSVTGMQTLFIVDFVAAL